VSYPEGYPKGGVTEAGISCLEHDDEYEKEEDENRNGNS